MSQGTLSALEALWRDAAGTPLDVARVDLIDGEALPSVYRVDELAAVCVAATHLGAADLFAPGASVSTTIREAALSFRSECYLRVDGKVPGELWAPLTGDYRAADGRWIRIHCNFAHHEQAALDALAVQANREAVAQAISQHPAFEIENMVIDRGGAAGASRRYEEWIAHPRYAALLAEPLVRIERISDGPIRAMWIAQTTRVLDLTRVIAGPVCTRTLVAYGAGVLNVSAQRLPQIAPLVIDTGFGKRST